jgi:alkanesulfonate monooxygenase
MPLNIYGMIGNRRESESPAAGDQPLDLEYIKDFAQAHDKYGFDRVLIGYGTSGADGFGIIGYAAAHTERLGFLLAHRPGFVAPTLAARKIATLDQITKGRMAIHVITARDNATAGDGDFLAKEDRYRRTDEYLTVLKKEWTSTEPFSHHGEFYHVEGGYSAIKPVNNPFLISFGGSSPAALEIAARQADYWAFYGEPLDDFKAQKERITALATEHGREIKVHISLRVILGATEEKAWARAHEIAERVRVARGGNIPTVAASEGANRLQQAAARGDVLDKRLFFGISRYSPDGGNSSALVGTPEQVAESMLDYYKAGASAILIRGFDPLQDAIDYGRDLLPIVRAEVARHDRATEQVAV